MSKMRSIALAVLAAGALAACGGGGADVKTTTTTVSVGQQLIDLQNAQKNGAISPQEYQRLKNQLIERVTSN
jgi:ABC-type glycerol-3-phosphate transport system substrate-binding protein